MKRYALGLEHAHQISDYGSSFHLLRLLRSLNAATRVDLAYLEPGDFIARHPAGHPQLFCVISGSGWVSGEDEVEYPIRAGEAAFWVQGEHHLTRSDEGLTAIILQSSELDPESLLQPIPPPE